MPVILVHVSLTQKTFKVNANLKKKSIRLIPLFGFAVKKI